jgi:hypothetical protein
MMSTLYRATDVELDDYAIQTDSLQVEDSYDTVPMVAVRPLYQYPDEEELYTSFEEAISDRLLAVQKRLSRISDPALSTPELPCDTYLGWKPQTETYQPAYVPMPLVGSENESRPSLLGTGWQRIVVFASLALMCILIGFDLMGLLALYNMR